MIVDPICDGYPDDPVWCHHCGTYSFAQEWGDAGFNSPCCDVCPVCGEVYPCMDGPLYTDEARAIEAAKAHEVVW